MVLNDFEVGRASSVGCTLPPGKQTVAGSILTSGTFFRGDLVMKKKFYNHSPPSAASRRAVVSYWRKNVHEVLVNCLGGLLRKCG